MPVQPTHGRLRSFENLYAALIGMFLALALLKWGNPVIVDRLVAWPANWNEWRLAPWPVALGYLGFGMVLVASLGFVRLDRGVPLRLQALPVAWFCWQLVATAFSINHSLSWVVLPHFGVCLGLFLIGLHSFSSIERTALFWVALMGGFGVVLTVGWRQHFGGLEDMRHFLYSLPNWQDLPPEFIKKAAGNRIYSTLVYPNALAGILLLLTPVSMALAARLEFARGVRWLVAMVILVLSGGCLVWSGSKGGWLIALVQTVIFLLALGSSRCLKWTLCGGLLVVGLASFAVKYRDYFERGAPSVEARFDYWNAALVTIKRFPVLGAGPGTFTVYYKELKPHQAEMTRLAHNDYLQQASDSGLPGGIAFSTFWIAGLVTLYRNRSRSLLSFSVFVGLFGVAMQGFVEFGHYIPGVAWVSWFLLGWALSGRNAVDKPSSRS